MGKQSLTRLASHLNSYKCFQIDIKGNYNHASFRDDLRKCYWGAGIQNDPTTFLITDSQILQEEFLEDLNSILNSGELSNLFEAEDYEKVLMNTRNAMMEAKKFTDQSRDQIYEYFIARVKSNLHIVICMSPVGDIFRIRW
jgi:dynein heavy chain